ncbi:MAG: hypothetical protein JO270_14555 [Acidobacteriaceae bacterium]|nr:hypothetical protein [Acidobacteriaceae bacterium]MBV8571635.1 hypothetical protein [Acidobacteriaceae bacterium]
MTRHAAGSRTSSGEPIGATSFKYYIHDGIEALRLQLIGELTEAKVTDLDGCWRTARTTLAGRPLIIDVQRLVRVDEAGKRWLAAMAVEGAEFVPAGYLRGAIASDTPLAKPSKPVERPGLWGRVIAWLRGTPVPIE